MAARKRHRKSWLIGGAEPEGELSTGVHMSPKTTSEFQDLVRCAEDGDFEAQYNLAGLYRCGGHVVLRNYIEAEKWYLPGVEQGRRDAQFGLGLLYLRGLGKRVEGMRLLALAGKQGDGFACYELAKALLQLSSQDRDPVAAYVWFCLAETYGCECEKEIQKLESELFTEQILGAQLRAREEFQPLVVLAAAEEAEARRAAEEAAAQAACTQAEMDRHRGGISPAVQAIRDRTEEARRTLAALWREDV
jgi:hypothetical protein